MAENESSNQTAKSHRGDLWLRFFLLGALAVAAGYTFDEYLHERSAINGQQVNEAAVVKAAGLVEPIEKHLIPTFTDTQGRLLADPPASPDQFVDPKVIVVAHLESSDAESAEVPWDQFEAYLAKATGLKVVDKPFEENPSELAGIKDNSITLLAIHAADTPFLVNNFGYEPAAVLADDSGATGNHLDLVVPADSPIADPSGLRGHSLACTLPKSITGYRAAIAMLLEKADLRPDVDYNIVWTLKQKKSIKGVIGHTFQAAAVSDDKLHAMLDKGSILTSQYKIIFQSEVIPRTTIGWFYNLKPELAAQLRQAILSFKPDASSADDEDASSKSLHFIPMDYKADFKFVREIDDRFDPRLDQSSKHAAATTEPSAPING
jgi:ABC-type phosphate/phosphonate transport system substrate-binding protein